MSAVTVKKLHALTGHRDCVYTVIRGGTEHEIFSAAGDGMIVRWDLNAPHEGELIATLPNSIYALHALPGTNLLVAGHNYDGIHVLDAKDKKEVASLQMSSAAIFDITSFENDLMVADGEGVITVIDRNTMRVRKKLAASEKSARVMAVNPKAGEVAVGYSDHVIRIFSLGDYTLKKEFTAHTNSIFTLAYTPDDQFLLSGSRDARLKAWDTKTGYTQAAEVVAHLFAINHITFSPSGRHFASCSMDKSIKIWKADELKLIKVIDKARHAGHGTSVNKLLWTSFNNQLVSASDDRSLSVWELGFDSE